MKRKMEKFVLKNIEQPKERLKTIKEFLIRLYRILYFLSKPLWTNTFNRDCIAHIKFTIYTYVCIKKQIQVHTIYCKPFIMRWIGSSKEVRNLRNFRFLTETDQAHNIIRPLTLF